MTGELALLLAQDGIANGAIYVLVALGIVLVFLVTRVIFVPFGDLVAYASLTLAAIEDGKRPGTVWLVLTLAVIATVFEIASLARRHALHRLPRSLLTVLVLPLIPVAAALLLAGRDLPDIVSILLTVALILPLGPLLYRVGFRPIADAPVLVLLIVSLVLHFAVSGVALIFFGPESARPRPLLDAVFEFGTMIVTGQQALMLGLSVVTALLLFLGFGHTITGKALRATAVNRVGARLVGIRPGETGAKAFLLAAGLAALSGILIGPTTTLYYDSGFVIGLKAFVGAIVGGLVSYPGAALGALFVGLLESFVAFWDSSLKDVVVFAVLVPILVLRSALTRGAGGGSGGGTVTAPQRWGAITGAIVVAVLPLLVGSYAVTLLNDVGLAAIVALGLVLLTGVGGLTSFGQAAFVGVGAYTTGWLATAEGVSPWLGLFAALAVTGALAAVLGAATLRLGGHLLPLSTIAWGLAIFYLFGNLDMLGRRNGMSDIPALSLAGYSLRSVTAGYYVVWISLGLAMLLCANLLGSRQGRAIRALRGGTVMVESLGISIFRVRLAVFVIAGLLAGLSGWLYAHVLRFVSPTAFDVGPGIEYLFMAMLGGAGHIAGAVVGAALVTFARDGLQDLLPLLSNNSSQMEIVVFSAIFILVLQTARGGLIPFVLRRFPRPARALPAAGEGLPQRAALPAGAELLVVDRLVRRFGGSSPSTTCRSSCAAARSSG